PAICSRRIREEEPVSLPQKVPAILATEKSELPFFFMLSEAVEKRPRGRYARLGEAPVKSLANR
ncbi:MAG: hypothetical protein WD176_10710, partial [Pirellulales bacterium]